MKNEFSAILFCIHAQRWTNILRLYVQFTSGIIVVYDRKLTESDIVRRTDVIVQAQDLRQVSESDMFSTILL